MIAGQALVPGAGVGGSPSAVAGSGLRSAWGGLSGAADGGSSGSGRGMEPVEDNTNPGAVASTHRPDFRRARPPGRRAAKIEPMRRIAFIVVAAGAALVAAFAVALALGADAAGRPRRVGMAAASGSARRPGRWPWRSSAIAAYSAFAALGCGRWRREAGPGREAGWLAGWSLAAVGVQGSSRRGPRGLRALEVDHRPARPGLERLLHGRQGADGRPPAVPGRLSRLDRQAGRPARRDPPARAVPDARGRSWARWRRTPAARAVVVDRSPPSVVDGDPGLPRDRASLPRADAAALALTGALTLLACAATVVPLYLLARSSLPPAGRVGLGRLLAAGPLGPDVPADGRHRVPPALDHGPGAGGLGRAIGTVRGLILAAGSGLVMAVGMIFTLAFLPVGLVVALIVLASARAELGPSDRSDRRDGRRLPGGRRWPGGRRPRPTRSSIWWVNQRNHARFYAEYPRSYLAWVLANPIELAVGLGLPAALWAVVGFGSAAPGAPGGLGDPAGAGLPDARRQEPQRGRPALAPADAAAAGRRRVGLRAARGGARLLAASIAPGRAPGPDPGGDDPGGLSVLRGDAEWREMMANGRGTIEESNGMRTP